MNIFFDINRIIYKYEKDGTLKKINDENKNECLDGICLITNVNVGSEEKYIYTNVFDYKTKLELIRKDIKTKISDFVFSSYIENKDNFIFALSKSYFLKLTDEYGFKKVYPLDFYLYKLKNGRNGIVSDHMMLIKKYENELDFRIDYLKSNANETLYYVNVSTDIYIQNLTRMSNDSDDINIAILSNNIKDKVENISQFNLLDLNDFIKIVKLYDNFYIKDKISNRYKKQVLHRYLYLSDIILISLLAFIVFFYLKGTSEVVYYNSEIESQSEQISKFDKLNKDILAQLPKMEFNKFPLEEARNVLIPLTDYDPSKIVYTFNIPKNEIIVDMTVSGISNVESLVKFLKDNNYENSYNKKEGYNFDFQIKVVIDKSKQQKNNKRGK